MKRLLFTLLAATLLATACQSSVFDLEVGQCFNDPDDPNGEIASVETVECTEPHHNEVYHVFDLTNDAYPGDDKVSELAFEGCLDAFDPYIGFEYQSSEFEIFQITPTALTWTQQDDREVVCAVYDLSGQKWTGTARNVGR